MLLRKKELVTSLRRQRCAACDLQLFIYQLLLDPLLKPDPELCQTDLLSVNAKNDCFVL